MLQKNLLQINVVTFNILFIKESFRNKCFCITRYNLQMPILHFGHQASPKLKHHKQSTYGSIKVKGHISREKQTTFNSRILYRLKPKHSIKFFRLVKTPLMFTLVLSRCLSPYILANLQILACTSVLESKIFFSTLAKHPLTLSATVTPKTLTIGWAEVCKYVRWQAGRTSYHCIWTKFGF